MAERQEIIDRVKQRLVDGSMTQEQARQVLSALPQQQQPQTQPESQQQPFQPMQQEGQQQERGFLERAGEALGGAISGVQEMFTGERRTGRDIERTPSLFEGDFLADLPPQQRAQIVGLAQITSDPNELAQIVAEQVPDAQIQYNRDEMGNVYPVLRRADGRAAMVDKPGMDLLNLGQMAGEMALFSPAGRAGSAVRGIAGATATEAGRQAVQSSAGGDFSPTEVALSGGIETAGRGVEALGGAVYRGVTGQPTDEVSDIIRASEQFDVPVMTSDVVPPRTPAGRGAQLIAETVPFVGTGGQRSAQQAARVRATDEFVDRFQGGGYDKIIQSLKDQREKFKTLAGKTYERVVPKLNQAAADQGGIPFQSSDRVIEQVREIFTRPGRKTSDKAINILDDIQETMSVSDQSFETLKDNIGAWTEAVESVDPAVRAQLTSKDAAQIKRVLASLRKDRDEFAESVLSPNEFRQLKNADAAYGEMADTMKNTRIKNVLNKGDQTPEVARNMLFSKKKSEVQQLYKNLTREGQENARATIIADIADRLSNSASGLTPDRLATELSKYKDVLDVFFRGDRRRELNGFLRLLDSTRRAQKAEGMFNIPTGQQTIPVLVGGGIALEPQLAAAYGSIGMLGRLYESPRVRSILARMASAEPGSTQFEQLAKRYREEVVRIAQSARNEEIPENLTGEEDDTNRDQ